MLLNRKILSFLFLLITWQGSWAHGAGSSSDSLCAKNCACHTPVPAGIMLAHVHERNQWMFSYRYMNMQMQGTMSGRKYMEAGDVFKTYLMSPENMRMNMHMMMVMYGITDRITVMGMGSFMSLQMNMSMFALSHHHGSGTSDGQHQMRTSGVGDVELHGLVAIVKNSHHQLVSSMGFNLPLGSIAHEGEKDDMFYDRQRLPYNMQTGSGSFELIPGITWIYTHANLSCAAQVTGTWRTGVNKNGYQWGNEMGINTWLAYNWWKMLGTSARIEGTGSGCIKGYDRTLYVYNEPAANPYNYGGKKLNVYAGLHFKALKGRLSQHVLGFEYGWPLYQDYNGIQMPMTQMLNASWSLTF